MSDSLEEMAAGQTTPNITPDISNIASSVTATEQTIEEVISKPGNIFSRTYKSSKEFLSRNFSGELFLKAQLPAGIVSTVIRASVPLLFYDVNGGNVDAALYTQLAGGAGYILSYVLVFFPLANKKMYDSYVRRVEEAVGCEATAQIIPNIITFGVSVSVNWTMMDPVGLHPSLAAIIGSWTPLKLLNFVGMGLSNSIYTHGGTSTIKEFYHSARNFVRPAKQ